MQVINKKIVQNILIALSISLFTGCMASNSVYSLNNKILNLGKNQESIIAVDLTKPIVKFHQSGCSQNSYTLLDNNKDYGKLFIEYISLEETCHWNGLPSGYFESNLRSELKLESMKTVENFEIQNYSFKTYKINNDSYLSLIYIYGGSTERFILDYKGKLYDRLLSSFKNDYENKYLKEKRLEATYNSSLVDKNLINSYYIREVERF